MDGRKGGQLWPTRADDWRHAFVTSQRWVCHACRVPSVSRACLRVRMPWTPVRLCKAGLPTFFCCVLPFSRVPVVCAHVVSCTFSVPSTLPFLHVALSFACQPLACMLLAVYSVLSCDVVILPFLCRTRCGFLVLLRAMWLPCLSFVACKSLLSAAREERCLALPCLPPLGPLGLCAGLARST